MGRKRLVMLCPDCGRKTAFEYVSGESVGDRSGFLPGRIVVAVFTLGLSEHEHRKHYRCMECGGIRSVDV